MSIAVTPSVVQDIVDDAAERELWIVGRLFERPPYFHAGKGGDTRLARALRVCLDNRILPNSDGTYMVEGSEHRTYRVGESCSCPQSQKASSKWCYHAVAVALYVEWQKRLRPAAPVALGTLPLPPVTVDERLAQAEAWVATASLHDSTALSTHHTPQEDRMPDDDAQYIPEPDDAPVAVLEAPRAIPAPRPLPGPVLLPSLDAQTLEQSMTSWSAQRQVIKRFLQTQLIDGTDYYTLTLGGKETKPTLSKAGSEKFLGLFQLQASFTPDLATWEMLGKPHDQLFYVCTLRTRGGEIVGEGRGARALKKDGGDINKTLKMVEKSAQVDAILRTGALSDVFTQDLDEDQAPPAKAAPSKEATPTKPTSQDLRQRIWSMVQAQAPEMRTREQVEAWIKAETGYDLHPDNYRAIMNSLEQRA
jgi:hypothetical protein